MINHLAALLRFIIVDAEEETDPYRIPTKQNMRMALYWLVQGCTAGDSLVFHYSGHGSRQRNYNGDEVDGFDETLCPLDFETQGMIVDDEINATIVRPLPHGVKLHSIIDACHSGTVLDLPFLCRMNRLLAESLAFAFVLQCLFCARDLHHHTYYVILFVTETELGSMCGRTIGQGQVCGKELLAEKPYQSVDVMMIRLRQTHQ